MAFWGIEVKPGKPYTHQYSSEGGRLRITQATLSYGGNLSTKKSVVQCNVGKKRPVLLCCLLPDKIETCPLNLEFEEENEEVIFSVLGPRSIYLTGYHLNTSRHHFNRYDDDSDSYGEDIAQTESDRSRDSDEDNYDSNDSFINDGDPEVFSPSPQPKTESGGEEELRLTPRFPLQRKKSGNRGRKRLKKKYQVSDSDGDKDTSQQRIAIKECAATVILDSEDEDKSLISSLFKRKPVVKNIESEETSAKTASEDGKDKKLEDDGNQDICIKRKIDSVIGRSVSRVVDQPYDFSLPSSDDGNRNKERPKKKKKKEVVEQEGKILEDRVNQNEDQIIGNSKSDVYKENEVKSKERKNKSMNQELTVGDELHGKLPNNDKRMIETLVPGNSKKLKKKKKADKLEYTTTDDNDSNALQSKEPHLESMECNPHIHNGQETDANLHVEKRVIDSLDLENGEKFLKEADKNEQATTEEDCCKPFQSKEPSLEIVGHNQHVDIIQESDSNLQDGQTVLHPSVPQNGGKLKKKKKKADRNQCQFSEEDNRKPLPAKEEPFLAQESNVELPNDKVYDMVVNNVVDENDIEVKKKKKKKKHKSKPRKSDTDAQLDEVVGAVKGKKGKTRE